jgi:hypothetical protein
VNRKLIQKLRLLYPKLLIKIEELLYILPDFIRFTFTKNQLDNDKSIVFVGTVMHARIARMAKWLNRLSDYKLILICSASGYSSKLSGDYFHQVYSYRNSWDLKRRLAPYDSGSVIFHLFGPPYKGAYTTVKFIKYAKKVFDFQDLMITNFGLNPPFFYMKKELKMEEYVLKNVDGIVNHSLELQTAKKYFGEIKAKKLFFPNYTDSDQFVIKPKKQNDEIHIVFVGSVHSAYRNRDYFGGGMLHWLIEKLNKQKIHFHIYPAPTNIKEHLVDYIEMDQKLEYFHLHESVEQESLSEEISKYDFGVLPFFNRTYGMLNDKRSYATTLKLYNYFESGLPIIIGEDVKFQNYMGKRFGGSIQAKWEDFDNLKSLLQKYNYDNLLELVKKNRQNKSLENNIPKLLDFYKNV